MLQSAIRDDLATLVALFAQVAAAASGVPAPDHDASHPAGLAG